MKIAIWSIGKTDEKYLIDGINKYLTRLQHYAKVEYIEFKDVKAGQTHQETTLREAEAFLSRLKSDDFLIILDEKGIDYTSKQFSAYIEKLQLQSIRSVVLLIGGAYGHHQSLRERANSTLSLSKMTFSHQMVRLFLLEQVYRAYTIIKNEKYHNE